MRATDFVYESGQVFDYTTRECVVLLPSTEGIVWAHGWKTAAAKALRVRAALLA